MSYGSSSTSVPFRNTLSYFVPSDPPVQETLVSSGIVPSSAEARFGNNSPINGPLLLFTRRTKPKRFRVRWKKVVIGYKFRYVKVYYNKLVRVRTKIRTPYTYYKWYSRVSKSGKLTYKLKRRTGMKVTYRYVTRVKLKFRKEAIRVPIKVRVKYLQSLPEQNGFSEQSTVEFPYPYLLPNFLDYMTVERNVHPKQVESSVHYDAGNGTIYTGATSEGFVESPFYVAPYSPAVGRGVWQGNLPFSPFLPVPDDLYLSATALHGLYNKVGGELPDTLTSLAELPETIRAIQKIFLSGVKLAVKLRRFDLQTVYRDLDNAAKRRQDSLSGLSSKVWLSWWLAVKPTIEDAGAHLELLSREDRQWRSYSRSAVETVETHDEYPPNGYFYHEKLTNVIKWSVIVESKLTVDEYRDKFTGSGNQFSAAWAVVPFSFIADWAVDISSYLSNASTFDTLKYSAWKTSVVSKEVRLKQSFIGYNSQATATAPRSTFNEKSFRVSREPVSELPDMPLIPWKRTIADPTVLSRALTSLSLIRVLTSKRN